MPDPSTSSAQARPSGTVTFLFTDIEGSARLAQQYPAAWPSVKARHHAIVQSAIAAHKGYVFQVIGDAFCAAFHTAPDALAAALDAQRALYAEPWGDAIVRVRMGLHTGSATAHPDGDYDGYLALVRVQRIMADAYGGQVLMSQDVADLVGRDLPEGVSLHDLGTHRLKDLGAPEHLHQLVAPGLLTDFPPLKTVDHPNNLPRQLTSFIGREQEVAELRRLLADSSLLTLTGAGGVGKTRLALQVASEELAVFSDGVWFIELAPLADPALIPTTIASAVGVREEPNRSMLATLGDHFRAKTALIMLDNCEHLIADAAQVCDSLLRAAPHLKIIATSREALGIAGELAYRVPSLSLPPATPDPKGFENPSGLVTQYEAVRLFVERAAFAQPRFALTTSNVSSVAQICRRVDGIPLAIELAASRMRSMTAEQVAARLDDCFRILTGGSRTALPRQQTLRAAVDWSYSLLSEPERVLLRRLAVFAGGWFLEAAEAVCSGAGLDSIDLLDLLTHLADKSLVVVESTDDGVRYRMLETIRQYAREKLFDSGEGEQTRNQHLEYFLALAQTAEPHLHDAEQATWFRTLDADIDNLRAAIDWGFGNNQAHRVLRLLIALEDFWWVRGHTTDGLEWMMRGIAIIESSGLTRRQSTEHVQALLTAAGLMWMAGRTPAERSFLEQALSAAMEIGQIGLILRARMYFGIHLSIAGDWDAARGQLEEAVRLARVSGNASNLGLAGVFLANVYLEQRQTKMAEAMYAESLVHLEESGNLNFQAQAHRRVGYIVLQRGNYDAARNHFQRSLELNVQIGDRRSVASCISAMGALALGQRRWTYATRMFGAAETQYGLWQATVRNVQDGKEFDRSVKSLHAQMEPAAFAAAWTAGAALSYDEAIACALEGSDA